MHVAQFTQFAQFTPVYQFATPVVSSFSQYIHVAEGQANQTEQQHNNEATDCHCHHGNFVAFMPTMVAYSTPLVPVQQGDVTVYQPMAMLYPVAYLAPVFSLQASDDLAHIQSPNAAEELIGQRHNVDMQTIMNDPQAITEQEEENYQLFLEKGKELLSQLMEMDSTNGLDFKFGIDGVEVTKDDSYAFMSDEEKAQVDADLESINQWLEENSDEVSDITDLGAAYAIARSMIDIEAYTDQSRKDFILQGKLTEFARTVSAYARTSFGVNNNVSLAEILGDHLLPEEQAEQTEQQQQVAYHSV